MIRLHSESESLRVLAALLALGIGACAPLPPQRTEAPQNTSARTAPGVAVQERSSPNFDQRRPSLVVLHHTTNDTSEQALRTLTSPTSGVSAHYLVDRSGTVLYLVDERERAWHAGVAWWAGVRDLNSASIGIELDNNGREPYAEPQIVSLLALLADLKARYRLPASAFIGHGDIAPGRKVDPSALFPWKRLADNGFGAWCNPPYPSVPAGVETALLLQAFRYNVWNLDAAVAAFKRRFAPDDPSPLMTEKDRSVLYCLVSQQQAIAAEE